LVPKGATAYQKKGALLATILVTGSAGFIGFHVAQILLARGDSVVGIDNLNTYYDPELKSARLAQLEANPAYRHARIDLEDAAAVMALFAETRPDGVVNLAAQAGVRYSLEQPGAYVQSNVVGFLSVLEACRAYPPAHTVYASTSSVYGANRKLPFSVHDGANHPITLYAATKVANEAMAHSYAYLFGLPMTGLRFFTVYGPWGRPDMALFKFTKAILAGEPIEVYGEGKMQRDFTFIDDIAAGVVAALDNPATADPAWDALAPDPASSGVAPWRVLNIGNSQRVELMRYIEVLEQALAIKADIRLLPMQNGDVQRTEADIGDTRRLLGYKPTVSVDEGVARFVAWYRDYYAV
jgi:UDP-glucuronate 4-epimerase